MDETVIERLANDMQIRDVLARYARGVDRMDEQLIRNCYHEGAVDRHGTFSGDVDSFVEWVLPEVGQYAMTQHLLAQTLIEYDDTDPDTAFVETYAYAVHRRSDAAQRMNWLAGFRYVDRFERRLVGGAREWRIADRVVIGEWINIDPRDHHRSFPDDMARGRRDGMDIAQVGLRKPSPAPSGTTEETAG